MLKQLRIDTDTGAARLILGLSRENMERLPKEPIGFSPRAQLAPLFVQVEGQFFEIEAVGIVTAETNEELVRQLTPVTLPLKLDEAVRVRATGQPARVKSVFGVGEDGKRGNPGRDWMVTVELADGRLTDFPLDAVERVQ